MRRPGHREATTLGSEDDEFETPAAPGIVGKVSRVVPPFGEPMVGPVIAREDNGLGVGQGARSQACRRDRRLTGRFVGQDRAGAGCDHGGDDS